MPVKKKEYTFTRTLGEGTFGIVRSAKWNAADPPINVAVKVISKKILKGHDEIVQDEMDVLKVCAMIPCPCALFPFSSKTLADSKDVSSLLGPRSAPCCQVPRLVRVQR